MDATTTFITKFLGKLTLEYKDIDQHKVRNMIYEALEGVEINTTETALVASDIDEKISLYIATRRLEGLAKSSLKNYNSRLRHFASVIIKPIAQVTTNDLRIYIAKSTVNCSKTTANNTTTILRTFFTWLYEEDYLEYNPAKKLKSIKTAKRMREALTSEELEELKISCKTLRERALVEFLYATGCRVSEISNMNIKDIQENNSIKVIGKGDKERVVFCTSKAKLHLKRYLDSRNDDNEALFVASKGEHKRMGVRSIEQEIKKIAKRTNIEKEVFPHLLRHTFATLSLQSGADITIIQKIMGHDSPSTTQIYAQNSINQIQSEYLQYFAK